MSLKPTQAQPFVPPNIGPLSRNTHTYDLMQQCIHCGFCLPTCPTYAVLDVEMDSPRGRIYQMQAVAEGRLTISNEFVEHMNCCLGCRACETACPSGVQFGKLIEAAHEQIHLEATTPIETYSTDTNDSFHDGSDVHKKHISFTKDLLHRFFFHLMLPSRLILSLVFAGLKVYQRSGLQSLMHKTGLLDVANALPTPFQGQLKIPEALMSTASGDFLPQVLPEITPALGERRYLVGFLSGCIMDQVFRPINEATIRVLTANGCEVVTPQLQSCCGALHIHSGEAEYGRGLARKMIDVFEQYECDTIVINSAGCGSTLKEYDYLLRDDLEYAERARVFSSKVKDISEFLTSVTLNNHMGEVKQVVAYHDACHLAHGQKIRQQPRQLLKSIPGLTLVDLKEADWCCGSAGIYNITHQEMGHQLLERKMDNVEATQATVIATGNPGCIMQIAMGVQERGLPMLVQHPVQLLDKAYAMGGLYSIPNKRADFLGNRQRRVLMSLCIGAIAVILFLRKQRLKYFK